MQKEEAVVHSQARQHTNLPFEATGPVPYASTVKIEAELDRLQQLGIITPVSYSELAAPIVAVAKPNGRVRICADYSTGLIAALEPHQHPLPLPQDIFAKQFSVKSTCLIRTCKLKLTQHHASCSRLIHTKDFSSSHGFLLVSKQPQVHFKKSWTT